MISDRGPCCMPAVHYTLHTCVRLCDYCTAVCSNYVALIESSLNWMSPVIPRCWRSRHLRFDLVPPNGTHTHKTQSLMHIRYAFFSPLRLGMNFIIITWATYPTTAALHCIALACTFGHVYVQFYCQCFGWRRCCCWPCGRLLAHLSYHKVTGSSTASCCLAS